MRLMGTGCPEEGEGRAVGGWDPDVGSMRAVGTGGAQDAGGPLQAGLVRGLR